MDINLERLLRQHKKLEDSIARVMEINADHPLIAALAGMAGKDGAGAAVTDAAWLLLDQARILGGEAPKDAAAFAKRMSDVMTKALG
jgi:molecular chaperone HtpG